jgi:hypothetical protein
MRLILQSDSLVVGRTLSDLLASMGCEIAPADAAGVPALQVTAGQMQLRDAQGQPVALGTPIRLEALAQQIRQLQAAARGAPIALAHGWRCEPLARMLHGPEGQHVPLTEKESLLLAALARALPGAAPREQLLREVWAYEGEVETHTLETHIYRLRSKLSALTPPPCDMVTSDGTYRLVVE